ncbi:putative reverse transcriptase domain-containing protein [Tanacetum coccineum]
MLSSLRVHEDDISKTAFRTRSAFPGQRVNQNGIHVDPSKIEAVKNWKAPTTPSEIRSFFGLAGYYRRFIANFSKIAKPLTSLTQKNQKYVWGVEQEEAFQTLKNNLCKANVVTDALSRKERVKPRRVRAMAMTIQYGVRGMILAAQSEAFKQENVSLVGSVMDEAHASRYLVHPGADKKYYNLRDMYWWPGMKRDIAIYVKSPWILSLNFQGQSSSKDWSSGVDHLRLRWEIYFVVLADAAESVRDAIGFEYCLASSSGWTKSPVLWAKIREGSLIGPELVQETNDKVVVIKEKLKAVKDRQKSYVDNRRKPLEFEVGDRVMLKVSPWKGVVRFGKKGKLAGLRLLEELSSVHDTFHVANLKKCLADANLHVPLDEIKVDKTLCFVDEPIEIMDREIKSLKRSKISLVKVRWNSKHGSEFTWEGEDYMKSKYPQLFVDRADESANSSFKEERFVVLKRIIVEVDPIYEREFKRSDFRKLPVLMVDGEKMVNTSGLIDELVKRMHPDSVCTCARIQLCWLSYKGMFTEVSLGLLKHLITDGVMKDEHYMKQGQNWKQNKRQASKLELEQSKLTAAISQLLTTMNDEPESKDGICQSDTDSKPTCGRPDEPLTSLKLTIIGHAPLASGAEIFFMFSVDELHLMCLQPPPKHIKLVQHENVTITPHLGASTMEAQEGVAIEIAEAVVGALRGELVATAVNAPMVPAEVCIGTMHPIVDDVDQDVKTK